MKHAIIIAARTLTVFIGLSLILMSVLLYETEEGEIENTLEKWWVFLSDTERLAVGKHMSFVAAVASLANRLFDRLLGERLLSLRAVGISACFSIASLGIVSSPALNGYLLFELPTLPYCMRPDEATTGANVRRLSHKRPLGVGRFFSPIGWRENFGYKSLQRCGGGIPWGAWLERL